MHQNCKDVLSQLVTAPPQGRVTTDSVLVEKELLQSSPSQGLDHLVPHACFWPLEKAEKAL